MAGFFLRVTIYGTAWWGLTAGALDAWQVGLPFIAATIYVDYRLSRPTTVRRSPMAWLRFALYFFRFSITGGIDVLRRTYHPRLPLKPGMVDYPLKLSTPSARQLFVCTVSLLPGTLSVQLKERELKIHVLDIDGPFRRELNMIENRVAALFRPHPTKGQTGRS
jgi:multicomponent Na+:H+ antiporter subunit E